MLTDLTSVYSTEKWQFVLTGIYPKPKTIKSAYYYPRTFLLFLLSSIAIFSMGIAVIIGVDDVDEFTNILYFLMEQVAYVCKLLNFVIGGKKIAKIESHLAKPINYKFLEKYGMNYLTHTIKIIQIGGKLFRFVMVLILIFYGVFPIFDEEAQLPSGGWFPVDKVKYRTPIYILQLTCFSVSATTNLSLDIYAVYIISIGITLLQMLKKCLQNVDYNEKSRNDITQQDLDSLVNLHIQTLEYVSLIEDLLSYGVFAQFLASAGVICLTGFRFLIVPVRSLQFVFLVLIILEVAFQISLYCWYGNEILLESGGIAEACYMSNWYEGTQKSKKVLFLIMERSKREITLTAGKFFILSLPTLVLIMKSSYSYFAVLQRMYDEE